MIKAEGSVVLTTLAELKLQVSNISSLVTLGQIKPSDLLFWNTVYSQAIKDNSEEQQFFTAFNHIFDLLSGTPNPDIKSNSPLKYSRPNRNVKIKNWVAKGIIEEHPTSQANLGIFTRGKVYRFITINLATIEPKQQIQLSKPKRIFEEEELSPETQIIKQIDKIYSFNLATTVLDKVLAPDVNYSDKTIIATVPVPTENNQFSTLEVKSTCFDDSRLMTPKDKIIAKYFISAALQQMWDNKEEFITHQNGNRFTFEIKQVLLSTKTADSGSARADLYASILRICGNKFEIDGSQCPEFMRHYHFFDENGNVMSKTTLTYLRMIGQTDEQSLQVNNKGKIQTPHYVTLAISENLYQPTLQAIALAYQNKDYSSVMPKLFINNEKLKFKEFEGYQDTFADFLKSKIIHGNQMKTTLKKVLTNWLKANADQAAQGVFLFLRAMDDKMFFYENKRKGARGQLRYDACIGFFGGFVFECKVIDPTIRQFVKLDYDVVFHHFYPHQFSTFRKYLNQINELRKADSSQFAEQLSINDEQFAKWYQHAISQEGMEEARKVYEQKKPSHTDSLSLLPNAIESV